MKRKLAILLAFAVTVMLFASVPMTAFAAGKGDFNGDGVLNTLDVRKMLSMVLTGETPTQQQIWWGDYDCNSVVDTGDARVLLGKMLDISGSQAIDYAKPTGEDYWGENSIALIGDSISWGAGTSGGISEYSYVSYVKKTVQNANSGKMNYGFVSAYSKQWANGSYYTNSEEIHAWPEHVNWEETNDGDRLMKFGMRSVTPWSTMTYKLRADYVDDYNYFCVYYHTEPGNGTFALADDKGGEVPYADGTATGYIKTNNTVEETKRTKFYRLSDCPKDSAGIPKIIICHDGTQNPVVITGIAYYKELPEIDNADGYVTFNAFTRGGAMLSELSYKVLEQTAKADTLIMSLGYNDLVWASNAGYTRDDFISRIDFLIEKCNENGTQVIVNDFTWSNYNKIAPYTGWNADMQAELDWRSENFSLHLRRLAEETDGIYIDHEATLGTDVIIPLLPDTVHPNNEGHKLIAQNVVAALGLEWTEDWT